MKKHLVLTVWAFIVTTPLVWAFMSSFKSDNEIFDSPWALPSSIRTENWARAWDQASMGKYLLNTIIVVGGGLFVTMLLGALVAYCLARYQFPGNRAIYYTLVAGMLFPVFLALVPLFFVVNQLGMLGTYHGLILVYAAYALPFTVFFLHGFFRSLPSAVAEAAFIDGASHTGVFFRVMLPMARPGLVTITPLNAPMDPNYGEIDFEYLPNGGWGEPSNIFYQTTWETYRPDPWEAVNAHGEQRQSFAGWHDLMFTVSAGHVKYYVDGALVTDHSGIYYPETPMSVNFNLWFIDSAAHTGGTATYRQQVDYFLHSVGEVLTPAQASARVNGYRASGITHSDTMGGGGSCPTGSPTATSSPSSSPSPSTSPSNSPSPTPSNTGGPGCANVPAWSHSSVYLGGAIVKHEKSANGVPGGPPSGQGVHKWRARWWTQGSEPGWTQQWEDLGRC